MAPRIYIDFDDVLCHTIESLVDLLELRHGRRVPLDEVLHFDLERSFGLESHELPEFMEAAHEPEVLAALTPRDGASEQVASWSAAGAHVEVVTGRPAATRACSERWLARHGMPVAAVTFVDKYGRYRDDGALSLDAMALRRYDLVVEDSLETAVFAVTRMEARVALVDRPWNRDWSAVPARVRDRIERCHDWEEVGRLL